MPVSAPARPLAQRLSARAQAAAVLLACAAGSAATIVAAGSAVAAPRKAPLPAEAAPWPDLPPLPLHRFTLANGMRVVLQPDASAPIVAVGLMVDVGSRDEVQGRSGLAHFFEHMMFQGSRHVGKMEHFNALEAVGADLNANTSSDRTYYFETVPKGALELALWLEYDRFAALAITADNVENQRQTVMEERRQRYDNQPYALARLALVEKVFDAWTLGHSTIGSMEDLQATPLEDFVGFWQRWYTPNNVVLALVGDITEAQAREVLARTLGKLPRRAEIAPRSFAFERRTSHQYLVHQEQRGKTPAFHLVWKVPAAPTDDAYALDLLAEVLSGGRTSRMERRLGRETGLATRFFAGGHGRRDVDLFHVYVELAANSLADLDRAKQLVRSEIADIALRGVDADELRRAKIAFESGWVFGRESLESRAEVLCRYELYFGDAGLVQKELPRYRAVTPAALQAVARQWLAWDAETEMDVLPVGTQPPAGAGTKPAYVVKAEAALGRGDADAARQAATEEAQRAKMDAAAARKAAAEEAKRAKADAAAVRKAAAEEAKRAKADAAAARKAAAEEAKRAKTEAAAARKAAAAEAKRAKAEAAAARRAAKSPPATAAPLPDATTATTAPAADGGAR